MARVEVLNQPTPVIATVPNTGAVAAPTPVMPTTGKTTATATDSSGRKITVRWIGPLQKLRLFAVAGELSKNESWMSLAAIAWAVTAIDGDPVAVNSVREIEHTLERLGDSGLEAAALAYVSIMPAETPAEMLATAKN
jgi:hypothetical protein